MRKTSFLSRLHREGKLQLVEPSETVKNSYAAKSESNLASAKILLENQRLEESVTLVYYSMYNMLTAVLFQAGIKCENHKASISLLSDVFGVDNKDIAFAREERIDKQYYVDFSITREDAAELIDVAEEFNRKLFDFSSKLSSDKIKGYRNRLRETCLGKEFIEENR